MTWVRICRSPEDSHCFVQIIGSVWLSISRRKILFLKMEAVFLYEGFCSRIRQWTCTLSCRDPTPQWDSLLNVKWEPATRTDHVYLNIDTELSMQRDLLQERMRFWEDMLGPGLDRPWWRNSSCSLNNKIPVSYLFLSQRLSSSKFKSFLFRVSY